MKTNLKKMLGLAALGMSVLTTTVPTLAGYRTNPEVTIASSGTITYAHGSMAGARYSGDTKQNLGCTTYALPFPWVTCLGTDKTGNTLMCGSGNPRWVEAAQSITDSSFFYIQLLSNNFGDCGFISNATNSSGIR